MANPPKKKTGKCGCRFVKRYRHYLTGKIMIATDYGYTAWCFFKCYKHR